ncbi:MAG TPA: ABC transporter permease subunit [Candidatus Saccharimonadales bacterium]|nr:ABC transporter permease subunit [Candidatus Saccharimonadales bacterium]
MRFAAGLHTSRRHHVLKTKRLGSLIAFVWLAAILLILVLLLRTSQLDYRQFLDGFAASLARTSVAYVVALIVGLILALSVTAQPIIETIFLPILDVLQSFPSFALFPVLIAGLAGHSETIILAVLALEMIWPILFSIVGAVKNRRQELEEAATIFGAVGTKRLWHFALPELWPAILTGSIVGWGEGWEFIIGAELLVRVHVGIGHYLGVLGENNQRNLLAFGIVGLMLLLFMINKLFWLPLLRQATAYQNDN